MALSSAEAKYFDTSKAVSQAIWSRKILDDIGRKQKSNTIIYCDNKSAIDIAQNHINNDTTKHIAIKYHYHTNDNLADIFTKEKEQVPLSSTAT